MVISQLGKPAGQWCEYWEQGVGCKINEVKPDCCKKFQCLWIADAIPDCLSPRKTGVVAWVTGNKELILNQDSYAQAEDSFGAVIKIWNNRGQDVRIIKAS
jgi:hypothetical protein